jgi:hypothetical protein
MYSGTRERVSLVEFPGKRWSFLALLTVDVVDRLDKNVGVCENLGMFKA